MKVLKGYIFRLYKELKNLSIRKYECPMCHTRHDRDFNAGMNIMFEGLKIYIQDLT